MRRWDITANKKMKKYLYFLLFAVCVLLVGCKSRNEPSQTSKDAGYIQIVNNTSDPYHISIKGNTPLSFSINGKTSITKTVTPGYYGVHIKQQSGYYLYPTEKDYEVYVKNGNTYLISF